VIDAKRAGPAETDPLHLKLNRPSDTPLHIGTQADADLRDAWRAVANAKLHEYRRQCWRLAHLVRNGALDKQAAIDALWTIAIAHALIRALGEDRVGAVIAEAFA
jgi:hypothetical protein